MSRRWLLPLLACTVCTQTALNLARPVTSYRVLALGGDGTDIGLVTAAYALLPVLVALPLGRRADRTQSLAGLLVVGAALLVAGPLLVAAASSVPMVGVAGAALGLGHLAFMVAGQGAVARWAPETGLDRTFGWFTAATSLGQLLGALLAGVLLGDAEGAALDGATRGALLAAAAVAGPALALAPLVRPGRRGRSRPAVVTAAEPGRAWALLRTRGVGSGLLTSLALLAAIDILTAYLPLLAAERGIAPQTVGLLLALRSATSLLSRLLLGPLLRRWSRAALLATSTAGAAATLAVLPVPGLPIPVLAAVLAGGGFLLGLGQPLTMTLVVQAVSPRARAAALALRLMGNRAGQVAVPAAAGLVAGTAGAAGALWLTSGMLAGAALTVRRR